jgi:hypothetical protein
MALKYLLDENVDHIYQTQLLLHFFDEEYLDQIVNLPLPKLG